MSDSLEITQSAEEAGLQIASNSSIALLPEGAAPALEEMVSRSLAHIRANPASGLSQSGCELVVGFRAGDEREFEIAPGVKIVMCWIPPGEFLMGSPEDEEGRFDDEIQHRVKITRGFWLAKTQTTQAQWWAVMGNNPSPFEGDDLPVEMVSWNDICGDASRTGGFLGKLNQSGSTDGRFDLPTEAQWEYACRAGTTGPYAGDLDEMAWYDKNSGKTTHPVGLKKANSWGLHDLHGNVWEWCLDWFGGYNAEASEDPAGPFLGRARVIKGGCSGIIAYGCRAAVRSGTSPSESHYAIGFRIARSSLSQQGLTMTSSGHTETRKPSMGGILKRFFNAFPSRPQK
jgi:formylglycine-generating enzyme required for sulfatase activity